MSRPALANIPGVASHRPPAESRWWLYAVGSLLIIAGSSAVAIPFLASLAVELVVGWAFVVGGVSQLLYAARAKGWSGFVWQVLLGAVFLVGGVTLITNPVAGLISLTLVIIATFLASGVLKILIGFRLRPLEGWGWFVVLGLLSLAVGVLIWNRLPSSAAWSLGLLVGLDFLAAGLVFLLFGLRASRTTARAGGIT
jgi:uncharacterized membrane protein HdeD (DUF308 family)